MCDHPKKFAPTPLADTMDPLSATASEATCYQLASEGAVQYFRYLRGERRADRDCDLVIARIEVLKMSLHHLQQMLTDERSDAKSGTRLNLLNDIVDVSRALRSKISGSNLGRPKLERSPGGNCLSIPLAETEGLQAMTTLCDFAGAVNMALSIGTQYWHQRDRTRHRDPNQRH